MDRKLIMFCRKLIKVWKDEFRAKSPNVFSENGCCFEKMEVSAENEG